MIYKSIFIVFMIIFIGGCEAHKKRMADREAREAAKLQVCKNINQLEKGMSINVVKKTLGHRFHIRCPYKNLRITVTDYDYKISFDSNCKLLSWDYSRMCDK